MKWLLLKSHGGDRSLMHLKLVASSSGSGKTHECQWLTNLPLGTMSFKDYVCYPLLLMTWEEPRKQMTDIIVKIYNSVIQVVWQEVKYLFDVAWVICDNHIKLYWLFIICVDRSDGLCVWAICLNFFWVILDPNHNYLWTSVYLKNTG